MTRVSGNNRKEPAATAKNKQVSSDKKTRKSYTVGEKLDAVKKYYRLRSYKKCSTLTGISRKQIIEWVRDKDQIIINSKSIKSKRVTGGGQKRKHKEIEDVVYEWVVRKRR